MNIYINVPSIHVCAIIFVKYLILLQRGWLPSLFQRKRDFLKKKRVWRGEVWSTYPKRDLYGLTTRAIKKRNHVEEAWKISAIPLLTVKLTFVGEARSLP